MNFSIKCINNDRSVSYELNKPTYFDLWPIKSLSFDKGPPLRKTQVQLKRKNQKLILKKPFFPIPFF